jgi:hypothetical protein
MEKAAEAEREPPLPLHVILSTPTGSGKTFTALMVHLRLLKVKHPNIILVGSGLCCSPRRPTQFESSSLESNWESTPPPRPLLALP